MRFKISSLLGSLVLFFSSLGFSQVPAFPGAEGFGATSIGGRGGSVCEVTNLNDSGSGSFRNCVLLSGPRTVVFRVGGTINLTSRLEISNGRLTIAGQTAPGDGILIRTRGGIGFGGETPFPSDIIVRYIRFRSDMTNGAPNTDTVTFSGSRIIFDHISASWGTDATFSAGRADNSTVQWSIISEGQTKGSEFSEGSHHLSIHHNLWAHHYERSPKMRGENAFLGSNVPVFDFVNNVIYNWGNYATGLAGSGRHNAVNNYYKAGISSSLAQAELTRMQGESGRSIYVGDVSQSNILGNFGPSCSTLNCNDQWNSVIGDTSGIRGSNTRTDIRHVAPFISTTSAIQAFDEVLDNVGASLPKRDSVDTRIINDVRNGAGRILGDGDTVTEPGEDPAVVFGWPVLANGTPPTDSDHDGMSDSWEISNFGNLSKTGTADSNGNGYTDLEEYLNSLVTGVTQPPTNPLPTVILTANPTTITQGQNSNLSWISTDATSASINQGIGTVSVNGSQVVSPQASTNYTITVSGLGGQASASALVSVNPAIPTPTVVFSSNPTSITQGQSSILSWSTSNATLVSINQGIGNVSLNGTTSVSPVTTTTYILTASGTGGSTTSSVTITVSSPPPPPPTGALTVLYPNGGEIWTEQETRTIRWNTGGFTGNVRIRMSYDGGISWSETLISSTPNDGSHTIKVLNGSTTKARIRIDHTTQTNVSDSSDANFTVRTR